MVFWVFFLAQLTLCINLQCQRAIILHKIYKKQLLGVKNTLSNQTYFRQRGAKKKSYLLISAANQLIKKYDKNAFSDL